MLSFFYVFAQNDLLDCKMSLDVTQGVCDSQFTARTDAARLDDFDPVVLNIYFWEIRRTFGTIHPDDYLPNWDFEKESLDVVASLNIRYNPYKIFFKYIGSGNIDSDFLYSQEERDDIGTILNDAATHLPGIEVKKENAYNVYIAPKISGGSAVIFKPNYIVSRSMFDTRLDASDHEIGHTLGLLHTFYNHRGIVTTTDTSCEHVTRDPNDIPNYNANNAGDRVPDTAAAPDFSREVYWDYIDAGYSHEVALSLNIPYYYINNCQYTGAPTAAAVPEYRKDCEGTVFEITEADVRNLMAYSPSDCPGELTMGQGIRAREAIEIDCYGKLFPTRNPLGIASLYEPYRGSYPEYYPHPLPWEFPLFQPGFDYRFVECGGQGNYPQPSNYSDTSFYYDNNNELLQINSNQTDYSNIAHPNHSAIRILQFTSLQPRKCYDNYNSPPIVIIGGTVIKFNDNVFNTNVTITSQDSTSINNENLINDLQPGLYNIIEQHQDGNTEETVIFKENN